MKFLVAAMVFFSFSAMAADQAPSTERMGEARYIIGGIVGVYPGFGLGHVIQSRWLESGYIFTAGEISSAMVLVIGAAQCIGDDIDGSNRYCGNGLITLGIAGLLVFKVWEIIDVWSGPVRHNQIAGRELPPQPRYNFGILPPTHDRPAQFAFNYNF